MLMLLVKQLNVLRKGDNLLSELAMSLECLGVLSGIRLVLTDTTVSGGVFAGNRFRTDRSLTIRTCCELATVLVV